MKSRRKHSRVREKSHNNPFSSKEDLWLIESAKIASSKAIRASSAMGITIKIIKANSIIAINPDKSEKVIRTISRSKIDTSSLKKGIVLQRK